MRRHPKLVAVLVVVLVGAAASPLAYRWAYTHSFYYSGGEPATLSCTICHVDGRGGGPRDRLLAPDYDSPLELALGGNGRRLYVTAQASGDLLTVDLEREVVVDRLHVGTSAEGLAVDGDRRAWVASEWDGVVIEVDLGAGAVSRRLEAGRAPSAVALVGDELWVANRFGDDLSAIDLASGAEVARLAAGSNPAHLAASADGARVVAVAELAFVGSPGEPPVSEVTVVDPARRRVTARAMMESAHLMEGAAVLPEGDLALVTLLRPKNLVPIVDVARGWTMSNGLGVVDLATGEVTQVLLDDLDQCYADPHDVAVTPDGSTAFVTHSGVDRVTVVDVGALRAELAAADSPAARARLARDLGAADRIVRARIATAANPKGVVVSPDGRSAYVAERLDDSILVIDVATLQARSRILLDGVKRDTVLRRGEKLFHNAGGTFQNQFSCRSCHPNNHVDRLQYDFEPDGLGRNVLDNRTLLGISATPPFKWNGKNTSMFMQCGFRFSKVLTRSEPFSPDDLAALVAFMHSLPLPPNAYRAADGRMTEAQARGKVLFERAVTFDGEAIAEGDRCITCHPPPFFTNLGPADVGSASPTDTVQVFDTPQLNNIYASPPYLHDGRARTLEEIWTRFNPDDTHGITRDLSQSDLNDLIEYLKTL